MDMRAAIELAIADHRAMNKDRCDYEFVDALNRVLTLLALLAETKNCDKRA